MKLHDLIDKLTAIKQFYKYYCPICLCHYQSFKDYTGMYYIKGELIDHFTPNAICPGCGSDIRHRFILSFLEKKTNVLNANLKFLHFAPEKWIYDYIMKLKNIEYYPCDIDPSKYEYSNILKVDMTDIPFPDSHFDAVLSIHVLEHIKNDIVALHETYRVLKKGGWTLISTPIYGEKTFEDPSLDDEGRYKMYGLSEHMRMNGLDFVNKLLKVGFAVEVYSTDTVHGKYLDRSVSSPHVESDKWLFYCKKK